MKHPFDKLTLDMFGSFFGTSSHKMVRRKDPDTSRKAAKQVDSASLERMVYEAIRLHPNGCISDDVCAAIPGHGVQTVSPRYAQLLRKGFIEDTGERRLGKLGRWQRVMRVITIDGEKKWKQ